MKTLFAAVLVALFAVCGCDAASDEGYFEPDASILEVEETAEVAPDLGSTEVSFEEVDPDATLPEQSASPVPVSNGLDVRLVWTCGAEEVTGYTYYPRMYVTPGTPGQTDQDYHDSIGGSGEAVTPLYKGTSEWEPLDTESDPCKPNSGVTSFSYALPIVPTNPGEYLVTLEGGTALTKVPWATPYTYFVPNTILTMEVWCLGKKVESVEVNQSKLGLKMADLDVFKIHTSTEGCEVTTLNLSSDAFWCAYGDQCGI